jgi:hypothetical protein
MLAHPLDQGPKAARREQQGWHGRASVAGVLGPSLQDLLLPAVRQLNPQVIFAVTNDTLARTNDLTAVRVRWVADPNPISLEMMNSSIMPPSRRRRQRVRSFG